MSSTLRRALLMMLTALVGVYALINLRGPNGLAAFFEKREAIRALEDQNRTLEDAVELKAKYVEDVKAKKPEVIFPLIRKRTGWVRDGEQDFRLEKEPKPAPAKPE